MRRTCRTIALLSLAMLLSPTFFCGACIASDSQILQSMSESYQKNDHARVIQLGALLKEKNEDTAKANYLIGNSYSKLSNFAKAEEHYEVWMGSDMNCQTIPFYS